MYKKCSIFNAPCDSLFSVFWISKYGFQFLRKKNGCGALIAMENPFKISTIENISSALKNACNHNGIEIFFILILITANGEYSLYFQFIVHGPIGPHWGIYINRLYPNTTKFITVKLFH